MRGRALVRRAFPYVVIAVLGFALAYVVVFVFVLPSQIIPSSTHATSSDSTATSTTASTTALVPLVTTEQPTVQPSESTVVDSTPMGSLSPPTSPAPMATEPVDVPNLVGMLLPDARSVLDSLRFHTVIQYDTSSTQSPNTILRQSPPVSTHVFAQDTVTIVTSQLPPTDSSFPPADSPE